MARRRLHPALRYRAESDSLRRGSIDEGLAGMARVSWSAFVDASITGTDFKKTSEARAGDIVLASCPLI